MARGLLWKRLETAVADHLGLTVLWIDAGVDARLALFTFAAAAVSVLLFGLVPALHAAKHDLYGGAKHEPSSPSPGHLARLRHLVVGQVALSAVLLALSALLMRAVESGTSADLGHPVDRLYLASLNLAGVEKGRTQPAFARVLEHVRGLAGVEGAALGGGGWPDYLPTSANPGRPRQNYVLGMAGPAHFATLAIPILSGREFDERDTQESPPVAILNQRLSEALWPGQDPVGRRLVVWEDKPALTVVGLVKTVRTFPLGPPFFQLYVPFSQHDLVAATLSVRIQPGQEDLVRTRLVGELRGLRLGLTCVRVRSLAEAVGSVLAVPRALVAELAALGAVALFLAAVGLYGLTAYVAGRRTQECAVRSMLGASRLAILRLLVGGTMRMVGIGLGLGLATSLILGWLLKDALLGAAFDPLAFAVPPLVLSVAAVVAVGLPTFRAASVDPMMALRNE